MWTAEKINLVKNKRGEYAEEINLYECSSLFINDALILNSVKNGFVSGNANCFQGEICRYCGIEGCNSGGYLMIRKQDDKLLFLPVFESMESFEEYDPIDGSGDNQCPPHKWFEDGILVVERDILEQLFIICPWLHSEKITEVTEEEINRIIVWEQFVKQRNK